MLEGHIQSICFKCRHCFVKCFEVTDPDKYNIDWDAYVESDNKEVFQMTCLVSQDDILNDGVKECSHYQEKDLPSLFINNIYGRDNR